MKPLVSIIVPNYNHSRFIDERMRSIFSQTFEDYEIILLDDASSDDSPEKLKNYAENPKVTQFVINETNSGSPFAQWKRGIELSQGKYIWIAESDDSSMPEFLETTIKILEDNPDMALCYAAGKCIDEEGRPIDADYNLWNKKKLKKRIGGYKVHDGLKYIEKNLYWACYVYNASATVIRKSKIDMAMFDDSIKMHNSGDWLFWSKLAKTGTVGEVYIKLNILRRHQNCATYKAALSGSLFYEDVKVLAYIEKHNDISYYSKLIRHGTFIKTIRRENIPDNVKKEILDLFFSQTGAAMWQYRAERVHRFLSNIIPCLKSMKNDRL